MPKVLIIEDRRENIVFIANNLLKPLGYDIITARDGALGLRKALEDQPDLIITDVKLPKMSGLAVLEELRDRGLQTPVIVMTFHGTEDTAVRALRLGAKDYLVKPFTFDELKAALDRALPSDVGAAFPPGEARKQLEQMTQELNQLKTKLRQSENQLALLTRESTVTLNELETAEIVMPPAVGQEELSRLNQVLQQTKDSLNKEEFRANTLDKVLRSHAIRLRQYQQHVKKLAVDVRNLSEGLRLMAQDMEQQLEQLASATSEPRELPK